MSERAGECAGAAYFGHFHDAHTSAGIFDRMAEGVIHLLARHQPLRLCTIFGVRQELP